jgi:dolichol-phosphate mannosyltransferase
LEGALLLSVVIPARDEAGNINIILRSLRDVLTRENIAYEIVVVDDASTDDTAEIVREIQAVDPCVRLISNTGRHGFGMAVRAGLGVVRGDAIAVMMADSSDDPEDLVRYFRTMQKDGVDCVFGSRFIRGSRVVDYPSHKLLLNRMANLFIRLLFGFPFNDTTNAFKLYSRNALTGLEPLIAPHFNLTVEMPLKALVRGYSYSVIPISWTNRKVGVSKLKIKEMGSRYLFIVLYLWFEKHLARGDYNRHHHEITNRAAQPHA